MYITFASAKTQIRQNPLWLWNPEETSPEIQNRGTSEPKKDMCPPKTFKKSKHLVLRYYVLFLSREFRNTFSVYEWSFAKDGKNFY